ncbi:hypothetical protein [Rhodopirellula islandica]|uniref:hypothetical protein n=1 Tax=Rhodopirellula islandica TaxID=595434 RepID=UPI0036F44CD1
MRPNTPPGTAWPTSVTTRRVSEATHRSRIRQNSDLSTSTIRILANPATTLL